MQGQWRVHDVELVETSFRNAGPDGQPSGAPNRAFDYAPHAGWADYDDSGWEAIPPGGLSERRTAGRVAFNWYRIHVTVPERVGGFETRGATLVFETSIDDYAEVWVDGELPRAFEQRGGSVVAGWNAPNRLVVGRNVRPGQSIQLAVFGINGPISAAPTNYIWMREARLDFYPPSPGELAGPRAVEPQEVNVEVTRLDPAIDRLVPANAKLFKLATGFTFIEGPVWYPDGYLLFSDPNDNAIYRYRPAEERLEVFREKSGYAGDDIARYTQPGSNGLGRDSEGGLVIAEHGNRRVTRLAPDGKLEVLADRYQGKRLNSPNDLIPRSDGSLYFTDPPFGLPGFYEAPEKELPFSGVFRIVKGKLELLSTDLLGPNGIDFSPDERYLYVTNWDPAKKIVMRYPVKGDGTLGEGDVFFDMTGAPGEEALDGLEIDALGNLYVSGPGGIWVLSPEGRHLGTIRTPRLPANFAWGDDGKTLYLTARSTLYRLPLLVSGRAAKFAKVES